jgi:hypothetical protein
VALGGDLSPPKLNASNVNNLTDSGEIELSPEDQLMQSLSHLSKTFPTFYNLAQEENEFLSPNMQTCLMALLESLNSLQINWVPNSCPCRAPNASGGGDDSTPIAPSAECASAFFKAAGIQLEMTLLRYFQSIAMTPDDSAAFAAKPRRKSDTPLPDVFGSSRRSVTVSTVEQKLAATANAKLVLPQLNSGSHSDKAPPTKNNSSVPERVKIGNSLVFTCLWLSARITKLRRFGVHESCKLFSGSGSMSSGTMRFGSSTTKSGTMSRSRSWSKALKNTLKKSKSRSLKNLLSGSEADSSQIASPDASPTSNLESISEQILSQDSYSKRLAGLKQLDIDNFFADACSILLGEAADHSSVKFSQSLLSLLFEIATEDIPGEDLKHVIQDLTALKVLLLALPNSSGLEADLMVVERLFLMFELQDNVFAFLRDPEWPYWALQLIVGQEAQEEQKIPTSPNSKEEVSLRRLQSWQTALEDPIQDRVFRIRMQLISKLISSCIYQEHNGDIFRNHMSNFSRALKFSEDIQRLILYASLNVVFTAKTYSAHSNESKLIMLRNLLDFMDSICEFIFFSGAGDSKSFFMHVDSEMQFPDIILCDLCSDVIDKMVKEYFEKELASQITSDMEKIRDSLLQYKDVFNCAENFFSELQGQASGGGGVDMATLQPIFPQLASKLAALYAEDSFLAFLDRKKKTSFKEKEMEESIRLYTVFIFQNRHAAKGKRGHGTIKRGAPPSGLQATLAVPPSEGVFQEQRSDLSTRMVLAHNLVRQKMGKKALVPKGGGGALADALTNSNSNTIDLDIETKE